MPLDSLKSPLLGMYYLATLPQRKQLAAKQKKTQQVPVMALFYHRVADSNLNDWSISNENFQRQISWLQENFDIITLQEAQHRISSEANDRPSACITFDDGYAENCEVAIPWLLENKIPFTYFVTTNNILSGNPFEHDVKCGTPLQPNTVDQLLEMKEAGIEIGAHTRSHADLGKIEDEEALYEEIVGSKRDLEAMLETSVRYFAFPYGLPENMSEAAFRIAFQAGFWGVCSAFGGYNVPGDDSFHIQRFHGDPSWNRFRNWLTVDPRKLNREKQFHPGDYRVCF